MRLREYPAQGFARLWLVSQRLTWFGLGLTCGGLLLGHGRVLVLGISVVVCALAAGLAVRSQYDVLEEVTLYEPSEEDG